MKLLVSDYDGTYYINDQDILLNNRLIKNFMKDNIFVIATGRTYIDFNKVEKKYNIKYNYLIINHGSTILKDNNIIYNKQINNSLKNNLINDLELSKAIEYFASKDKVNNLSLNEDNLNKIYIKYKDIETCNIVYNKLIDKYKYELNIYIVGKKDSLEIVSYDSTKEDAIKYIINILKINNNNVYTIGDNYTDINMIKIFNGYTMSNSIKEIKLYANKEYDSLSKLIVEIADNKV